MEVKVNKGRVTFEGDDAVKFGYIKGTSKWAKVIKAGEYGHYSIDLYGEEIEDHIPVFEEMRDKAVEAAKGAGKKVAVVADVFRENEDTGEKYIQFKLPEEDFEGKPTKIKIYDIHGKLVEDWDKLIGNGSVVKVKYRAKPYYFAATKMVGISYRFYAVQVIKLEEYSGGDSGFGDESDGNEAPFDTTEEY